MNIERNLGFRILKKFMPVAPTISGEHFLIRVKGILYATPLLIALAVIEVTDLVFAMDSIPAIIAITRDPFIVITSNVFAILGLRSLYLLLAGLMEKLRYLRPGLIALLFFIGIKMMSSQVYHIPVGISLIIISTILGSVTVLSLLKTKDISSTNPE